MDKTMCELFAGVGGFRLGMERLNSGWKTTWFSQWEPGKNKQWAHDCYVEHFGDSKDLKGEFHTGEDISVMIKENIPDHNLLVGGFPCLTGDTLVLTKDGYKQLIDVKKGDFVLSHDGTFNKVTNFYNQGTKETYSIKGYGFENIHATGNHKFYVRGRKYTYSQKKRVKTFSTPRWISVDELYNKNPKDIYFGNKINSNSIIPSWNGIDLYVNQKTVKHVQELNMEDEKLWYLVGRYIGDGWLKKQQKSGDSRSKYAGVIICGNTKKIESLSNRIGNSFPYTETKEKTVTKLIFSNTELAMFLEQFGVGAENKKIPGFVYDMPVALLKNLVEGYLDSDGCKIGNRLQFSTVSRSLAYGIAQILEKAYQKPCQIYLTKTKPTQEIEGRIVNQHPYYLVRCILQSVRKSAFYEDGYIWYPLHKIEKFKEEQVYDIEVENTHSFIANGAITHNCQDYSVAHSLSSSHGIEGKKGVLWWQIRDTLIAKQPAFCMFENVDRLLKSPASQRGRDFGIILACLYQLGYSVEWRVVNAADYGASQRRRRTFIFAYKNTTEYAKKMFAIEPNVVLLSQGFMAQSFPVNEIGEITSVNISDYKLNSYPSNEAYEDFEKTINKYDIENISNKFAFAFNTAGFMKDGVIYTCSVEENKIEPINIKSILESNVDESYYISEEAMPKWIYLKGSKKIPRKTKDGHEYIFSEGPVAFPDPWDRPGRTMLTSESTLNRSSHVVADPGTGRYRILTPVETERLQGFDDNWTALGGMPQRMRYFCMGNALVVPMITRMGTILDQIISQEP